VTSARVRGRLIGIMLLFVRSIHAVVAWISSFVQPPEDRGRRLETYYFSTQGWVREESSLVAGALDELASAAAAFRALRSKKLAMVVVQDENRYGGLYVARQATRRKTRSRVGGAKNMHLFKRSALKPTLKLHEALSTSYPSCSC